MSSSYPFALCLLFSLSFVNKLATIFASRLLQLHLFFYLALPIILNSLDREGARLLSRCGSQITITPDAGSDDSAPGDVFELKRVICTESSGPESGLIVICEPQGLTNLAPSRSRLFKLIGKAR